jgi:hypothetical protein
VGGVWTWLLEFFCSYFQSHFLTCRQYLQSIISSGGDTCKLGLLNLKLVDEAVGFVASQSPPAMWTKKITLVNCWWSGLLVLGFTFEFAALSRRSVSHSRQPTIVEFREWLVNCLVSWRHHLCHVNKDLCAFAHSLLMIRPCLQPGSVNLPRVYIRVLRLWSRLKRISFRLASSLFPSLSLVDDPSNCMIAGGLRAWCHQAASHAGANGSAWRRCCCKWFLCLVNCFLNSCASFCLADEVDICISWGFGQPVSSNYSLADSVCVAICSKVLLRA